MERYKATLKSIKRFLRAFDFFGESFTFRYKDEDKHSTALGGIICIVFYLIAISYFIYNFIPFVKDKNFTLQYYTVNSNENQNISLKDDPIAFGFGLTNENKNALYNIMDLFNISVQFTHYQNKNNKTNIDYHYCNMEDFHNKYDKPISEKLFCINPEYTPEGIYTEDKFSYYTISVLSKYEKNKTHNDIINDYLIENDCKLQFYYTDIEIDLTNKDGPFSSFLNSMFLQLNPTVIQKKNIYYANYHLTDDYKIIRIGSNDPKPVIKTGFSRIEDYSLYKGLDRINLDDNEDNKYYAKIYIRADNRKIDIRRRYQDLMEFYADTSGLLLSIFWILGVILASYDRIVTNHSISKRLFYFEGIKNNNFEQLRIIKELIKKKEEQEEKSKEENNEKNKENDNNIQNENSEQDNNVSKYTRSKSRSSTSRTLIEKDTKDELKDSNEEKIEEKKKEKKQGKKKEEKKEKKKEKEMENEEREFIDYSSYNVLEMIGSSKIFCCRTKKLKNKINLIEQANNMINEKLDIVFYIRNMILFQIINKIYLENKDIVDFLSRPIIYFKNEKEEEKPDNKMNVAKTEKSFNLEIFDVKENEIISEKNPADIAQYFEGDLYETAYKLKPTVLHNEIANLILHPGKTNTQKKLIRYLKKQLKGIDLEKKY